MRYEDIVEIAAQITYNDNIKKEGLTLLYELPEKRHRDLDEHFFYMINPDVRDEDFEHEDVIDVQLGDIRFIFIKEGTREEYFENSK